MTTKETAAERCSRICGAVECKGRCHAPELDAASFCIRHAAHKEKTRYAMNGLLVGREGLVATDGKMLAHITHRDVPSTDYVEDRVISLDTIKACRKAMTSKGAAYYTADGLTAVKPGVARGPRSKKASIPPTRTDISIDTVAGIFPPWMEVMSFDHHYSPVEVSLTTLEAIASVFAGYTPQDEGKKPPRVGYSAHGIHDVYVRDTIAGVDVSMTVTRGNGPATPDNATDLGYWDPALLGRVCQVFREFFKAHDSGDLLELILPKAERGRGVDRPVAKRALGFRATRGVRTLTALLMPLCID